jgi:hypothetical protein
MGGAGCTARRAAVWALAGTVMRRPVFRLELPGFLHASPDWALADLRWYARRAHLEFATGGLLRIGLWLVGELPGVLHASPH